MSGITTEYKRLVMEVTGNMPKPVNMVWRKLKGQISTGSSDYHPKSPYPGKAECVICQHFDATNKYCNVLNMRTDKAAWCLYFTKIQPKGATPAQPTQAKPAQAPQAQAQPAQTQAAQAPVV